MSAGIQRILSVRFSFTQEVVRSPNDIEVWGGGGMGPKERVQGLRGFTLRRWSGASYGSSSWLPELPWECLKDAPFGARPE